MKISLKILLTVILALGAVIPAAAQQKHHYELKVGEFDRLRVLDNVNVVWKNNPDSAGYVRFYAEERFADAFIFDNNGKGTLKIQVITDDAGLPGLPVLYVYSNFLTNVQNASVATVTVCNPPKMPKFKAEVIGNGIITVTGIECTDVEAVINTGKGVINLAGKASKTNYHMTGTGEIKAFDLSCDECQCNIFGTGSIYCNVLEELKVKGLGSTSIYYKGSPMNVKKRGGGKLIHVE